MAAKLELLETLPLGAEDLDATALLEAIGALLEATGALLNMQIIELMAGLERVAVLESTAVLERVALLESTAVLVDLLDGSSGAALATTEIALELDTVSALLEREMLLVALELRGRLASGS